MPINLCLYSKVKTVRIQYGSILGLISLCQTAPLLFLTTKRTCRPNLTEINAITLSPKIPTSSISNAFFLIALRWILNQKIHCFRANHAVPHSSLQPPLRFLVSFGLACPWDRSLRIFAFPTDADCCAVEFVHLRRSI